MSGSTPLSRTMTFYHLTSSIRSPGRSTTFLEFSPDSRFLAIGDRDLSSLFILDGRTGYYLSAATLAKPTALVWDTTETFYVGLSNGCFVHYQIDLETHKFVKGAMNKTLCGVFPVTAIALNEVSTVLALSVGPDVFIFHRIHTGGFIRGAIISMDSYWPSRFPFYSQHFTAFCLQTRPWESVSPVPEVDLFYCRQHAGCCFLSSIHSVSQVVARPKLNLICPLLGQSRLSPAENQPSLHHCSRQKCKHIFPVSDRLVTNPMIQRLFRLLDTRSHHFWGWVRESPVRTFLGVRRDVCHRRGIISFPFCQRGHGDTIRLHGWYRSDQEYHHPT